MSIDCFLHRRLFPEVQIARLVSAGNEEDLGMMNDLGGLGILRSMAVGNDQGCSRVEMAEFLNVGVVVVVTSRAQDQEVATGSFAAEPAESVVEIFAAAEHGDAVARGDGSVRFVANSEVLQSWRSLSR